MTSLEETVNYLIKSILPQSDQVQINLSTASALTLITVTAPPETIGQIIGKQGRIIKAIRTALNLSHPKQKFTLDIKG
jgi:predicted RNA-binding protein YlqC (UPF0109 family)